MCAKKFTQSGNLKRHLGVHKKYNSNRSKSPSADDDSDSIIQDTNKNLGKSPSTLESSVFDEAVTTRQYFETIPIGGELISSTAQNLSEVLSEGDGNFLNNSIDFFFPG